MASVLKTPRKIAPTIPQPFEWPRRGATQEQLLTAKTLDGNDVDDYCAAAEALEAGRMKNTGFRRQGGRTAVFSAQYPYPNQIRGRGRGARRFHHWRR